VLLGLAAAASAIVWLALRPAPPREVAFARVQRRTLVSTLTTNARVEPIEFATLRAAREGALARVAVERGQQVAAGSVVAEIDSPDTRAGIASAEARIAQAQADLRVFEAGGPSASLAEIDSGLRKLSVELEAAQREAAALERLVSKQAAPKQDLLQAQDRIRQIEADRRSLEARRAALLPPGGRAAVEARLNDAKAALEEARLRASNAVIRSPISGVVYQVVARPGGYVRPGDPICEIGKVDTLRVIIFVDEPELGRVTAGMPIRLTWDGAPGQEWKGRVEKLPTQITALNTRQVGEVLSRVDNPGRILPPGANANVEIESKVVTNALVIPKAALRREGAQAGVLKLEGDRVVWKAVRTGISSVTEVEVLEGVAEGDAVALPTESALAAGERVLPKLP